MTDLQAAPISLGEALALIATLPPAQLVAEHRPLEHAAGRLLVEPIVSRWPLPRFNTAAVDGWAFAARAVPPDRTLAVVGRLAAGQDGAGIEAGGGAVRIFTGAMMPGGADTVAMQEQAEAMDGRVRLPPSVVAGQHVRRTGEQAEAGAILVPAGRRLSPLDVAAGLAGGATTACVRRPLRVGLLATGEEVRAPGAPLGPGLVPDQNSAMLAALLLRCGATPQFGLRIGDVVTSLADAIAALAETCDLVITTGGVSVGEEDHLKAALAIVGQLLFWRVALKPGRPTALGLAGRTPVLALPGNPAAAFTAFRLLGPALVARLAGQDAPTDRRWTAIAGFAHRPVGSFLEVVPVRLQEEAGLLRADRTTGPRGGLAALASADALALLDPACGEMHPGAPIKVLPIDP